MGKSTNIGKPGRIWLSSSRLLRHESKSEMLLPRTTRKHCIVAVTSGDGALTVNGTLYMAGKGDVFVLPSGTMVEGRASAKEPVSYVLALFDGVQLLKSQKGWQTTALELPVKGRLPKAMSSRMYNMMEQWIREEDGGEQNGDMPILLQRKYKLQQLLVLLLKHEPAASPVYDPIVGFETALAYMNKQYMNDLRLEELASMAGLSINHFIRTFKSLMNMTPIKYVEKLRMDKAKMLLLDSGKIKEIARKVGYNDEHYFSRAFKKAEGVAPTLYIKNKCNRIATIYYGLDDYLMTLGLQPVASLSYARRVSSPNAAARQTLMHKVEYEGKGEGINEDRYESKYEERVWLDGLQPEYDKLLQSKPDLILSSNRLERDELLDAIAPSVVLNYSNDYRVTLKQVGQLFGKEKEARQWIDRYTIAMEEIKDRIKAAWGSQTACFVRVSGSFYRLYGSANQTGSLLHDDLGLSLPADMSGQSWLDLHQKDWSGIQADHIFLMTDPTEEAGNRLKLLQQSEAWKVIPAVREGRVYEAGDLFFRSLGPSGRLSAARRIACQLKLADGDIVHLD